jgi:protein involved in polysaccharide export with SLBB domain
MHSYPRYFVNVFALALLMSLGGCASSGDVVRRETTIQFSDEDRARIATTKAAPYEIQHGDIFSVSSLVDQELTQNELLVLPDGSASFVGLGPRAVAGQTVTQVEVMLREEYSQSYRDVDLTLVVHKTVGRQVYVLGEVRNPGLYDVSSAGAGIVGAIARAGGFAKWASDGSVVLMRLTSDGYLCRELDLGGLKNGNAFDTAALDLKPFDIIWVSRSRIGNFASFSQDVIGSLNEYTRLILDSMQVNNPESFRR